MESTRGEKKIQIPRKLKDMSSTVYYYYYSLLMSGINVLSSTDVGNKKYSSYAGSLLPTGLRSPRRVRYTYT